MQRSRLSVALLFLAVFVAGPVAAVEGPYLGLDLGASEPTNQDYRAHVQTGATASPYFGMMFNEYLGIQGNVQFLFQEPDNDRSEIPPQLRTGLEHANRITTMAGLTAGPRLSIPLGEIVELYGLGQGGMFKGMSGAFNQWAPGLSLGGGVDFNLTRNMAVGLFGRWNRAYMAPQPTFLINNIADTQRIHRADWATAGISLKVSLARPKEAPPPPPPAPVAQAAPPPPPVTKKIVLRNVHFDFNKAIIRPDAKPVLDEAVQILKTEEPSAAVIVEGHTDSVGSEAYNMKLSQRRADAVRSYLVRNGIAANRIRTEGFGKTRPVASNATADGRAQNRRVELHLD